MEAFNKTIRPGCIHVFDHKKSDVFCAIKWDGECLSITGVVGPKSNGNCDGGAGQIDMEFAHREKADDDGRYESPIQAGDIDFAVNGWDAEKWLDFLDVWKRWHNNNLTPGCEHQTAEGWSNRPIDPDKPTTAYGKHFSGQQHDSWNLLGWISPREHPEGLLGKACPICGYKYGTAWKQRDVPEDVLVFLSELPGTDKVAAWV